MKRKIALVSMIMVTLLLSIFSKEITMDNKEIATSTVEEVLIK